VRIPGRSMSILHRLDAENAMAATLGAP
jgi:hypothetical protein